MLTLREAAALLAGAATIDDLAPIARAAGCTGAPALLDDDTRRGLGLEACVREVRLSVGDGALRALLIATAPEPPLRDILRRVATRVSARAPHGLWLLIASQPASSLVGIAAWGGDRRPPRLSALFCERSRVLASDAETLRALAGCATAGEDLAVHARWAEVLGREALSRRFYRALEQSVSALASSSGTASAAERREIALLCTSRLLFLAFLEAKGWLAGDGDFLVHRFDECMTVGGGFHRRVLRRLFFGTLNTPWRARAAAARALGAVPFLNGGLFAPSAAERQHRSLAFSDEAFGAMLRDVFSRYRFTAREESTEMEEVAVDPEMLGRAFESLMASGSRRDAGVFYTPHRLVAHVTGSALDRVLSDTVGTALSTRCLTGEHLDDGEKRRITEALRGLTVLDPACGSGAFLVHAQERIAALLASAGDSRPIGAIRRDVLTRSIFGVDRDPTAVWLCELRLWLSVVIEDDIADPMRVTPLPNLDANVRVGDSLGGGQPVWSPGQLAGGTRLTVARRRYALATGQRKKALARELDRRERTLGLAALDQRIAALQAVRRDLLSVARSRDLFGGRTGAAAGAARRLNELKAALRQARDERRKLVAGGALPFRFDTHFADVAARGGFDVVLGNPPWVRPHRVSAAARERLRAGFEVCRAPAWATAVQLAGAGPGFGSQVDLAGLFVERAVRLVRPGGAVSLLLPSKLWRSLAGGGVRRLLARDCRIVALEDHSGGPSGFDAVVYPSVLVAERATAGSSSGTVAIARTTHGQPPLRWFVAQHALGADETPESPWLLLPRPVREAFDRLGENGVPLAQSPVGRPLLGVKCGHNAAFVVRRIGDCGGIAEIEGEDGRTGRVEDALLRPLLRGEDVRPWKPASSAAHILWTHDEAGRPLARLPEHAGRWLAPYKTALGARTDAKRARAWWQLFRTDSARHDRPRVVWADVGRAPRALVLEDGCAAVPLNTCYVARCPEMEDALALCAILNSALAAAWFAPIAEPARGGYRRFLGWTTAMFPLPRDWARARAALRSIAGCAIAGHEPTTADLLVAVLDAYALRRRDVAPLLAWTD